MPHQCIKCNTIYEDGSDVILKGCSCGGRLFFFLKKKDLEKSKEVEKLTPEQKEQIESDIIDMVGLSDDTKPVVLDIESVLVTSPGKYLLDVVKLFKKDPLVFKLEEGKYVIDLPKLFENIQKEIIMKAKAEVRMLVYRRFMVKIAAAIAKQNKARFLVTGDSLSQVSSQTIENLRAVYDDAELPILPPLIGLNKNEIMGVARRIGTYEISSQPYGDCCSYFLPKHPMLKAKIGMLRKIESSFDVEKIVGEAVKNSETIKV